MAPLSSKRKRAVVDTGNTAPNDIQAEDERATPPGGRVPKNFIDAVVTGTKQRADDDAGRNLSKSERTRLYRPTTAEEMHDLTETAQLFRSNLFKWQMEELLKEVSIDYEKCGAVEKSLWQLKALFENVQDQPDATLSSVRAHLEKTHNIQIPFPRPHPDPAATQFTFGFRKPAAIRVVGSFVMHIGCRQRGRPQNIDMVVEMPQSLFQEKDFTNHRYFHKRAYYLAMLAAAVKNSEMTASCEFAFMNQNTRCPVLVLTSSEFNTKSAAFVIRVIPSIAADTFAAAKLGPTRNNLRANGSTEATPLYNNALLAESAYIPHLNFMYHYAKECPAFVHAAVLMRVWLIQRGLNEATVANSFNAYTATMMMASLFQGGGGGGRKVLSTQWSSYQLFRVTLEWLAACDASQVIFMNSAQVHDGYGKQDFRGAFDVSIVDPVTGRINLLGGVSMSAWLSISQEAALTVAILKDASSGDSCFEQVFLKKFNDLAVKFDNVCTMPVANSAEDDFKLITSDVNSTYERLARDVPKLLTTALGKRVQLVVSSPLQIAPWKINSACSSPQTLTIGLQLDAAHSSSVIDFGPSSDDSVAVKKFRAIWGAKSEMRRFKDGSIVESVVWDVPDNCGLDERAQITQRATRYLLQLHFGVKASDVQFTGTGCFNVLKPKIAASHELLAHNVNSHQSAMVAFDGFAKTLRSLQDLPLSVVEVKPAHAGLRYSSVFIPQPRPAELLKKYDAPVMPLMTAMDTVVVFESSSSWPTTVEAIEATKTAFYIRMADCLNEQPGFAAAVVDSSETDSAGFNDNYLEVVSNQGYLHRCRIQHDRELTIIDEQLDEAKQEQNEAANEAAVVYQAKKDLYTRRFILQPLHTQLVQALIHQHPPLSHTIRLFKRWLASQWLLSSDCISEEVAELLSVSVFVTPGAHKAPGSAFCGLMRVLDLLATFNFGSAPLLVPLQPGAVTADKQAQVDDLFKARREADPTFVSGGAMYLVPLASPTEDDQVLQMIEQQHWIHSVWTADSPSAVVLHRVQKLASSSMRNLGSSSTMQKFNKAFAHSCSDYDIVVGVDSKQCSAHFQSLAAKAGSYTFSDRFKNLSDSISAASLCASVTMDAMQMFVDELKLIFRGKGLVFYDVCGGSHVGIVLNPNVCYTPVPFKIGLEMPIVPLAGSEVKEKQPSKKKKLPLVQLHIADLVNEIAHLGHGFVTDIKLSAQMQERISQQK